MGVEHEIRLMALRQAMGRPPTSEVDRFLRYVPELRRDAFRVVRDNKDAILQEFQRLRSDGLDHGITQSKPYLCAVFTRTIAGGPLKRAEECLKERQIPGFRFFYDVYNGMSNTSATIAAAEDELRGGSDQAILAYLDNTRSAFNAELSITEDAETYANFSVIVSDLAKNLQSDPTGFSLVDYYISMLAEFQKGSSSKTSPKYELVGAELARDLYKELYGMAGELYPQ